MGKLLESILKIDGTLLAEDGANAAEYGLDAPKAVVRFKTKNKGEITVSVGNPTPAETEYYAMDGGGRIYSVYTEAGNALLTKRWQLMNLDVFSSNYEDISAVSVVGHNAFDAEKQSTGIWSIRSVRDGSYEVTNEKFRGTVGRYFDNMYAKRAVLNTDENRARYGLDFPEGVIAITDRVGVRTEFKVTRDSANKEAAVIVNDGKDIFITIESYFGMLDTGKEDLN